MIALITQSPFATIKAPYRAISPFPAGFSQEWFSRYQIMLPPAVAQAVPKRQQEYFFGRYCAAETLRALQPDCAPPATQIGSLPDRRPVFPPAFQGSITHCDNFAAAICVPAAAGTPGLDAERILPVAQATELQSHIARQEELADALWPGLATAETQPAHALRLTLIFSAKEALFKALYPGVLTFFDFSAARLLTVCAGEQPGAGLMRFQLETDLSTYWQQGDCIEVQYCLMPGLVQTLALVKQPGDVRISP